MSELRKNPVTGQWVIFIEERRNRTRRFPHQYKEPVEEDKCPFCEGSENLTTPEIIAFRKDNSQPNTPGWTLRVIPDKFPILKVEEEFKSKGIGMYDSMMGLGAHEIVIESNIHNANYDSMSLNQIKDIFWAYNQRINDLKKDQRLKYILINKNFGSGSGAFMPINHPHSHIVAYPFIPHAPGNECEGAKIYWKYHNRCIYCDIIIQELNNPDERVIYYNDDFVLLAPFASRFPYEMSIIPIKHNYMFAGDDSLFESLAIAFKEFIIRMNAVLSIPPYNFVIHSAPLNDEYKEYYHWHIHIRPRISQTSGFEWGSGTYLNAIYPESVAKEMREVEVKSADIS